MNINNYLYKRMLIFIFTLSFVILMSVSASFAFNNSDFKQMSFDTRNLQIVLSNSGVLAVDNRPYGKNEGVNESTDSTITITNNQSKTIKFSIVVSPNKSESLLSCDKLYYSINKKVAKRMDNTRTVLYEGSIDGGKTMNLDLNIWVGSDLISNNDLGKSVKLDFKVIEN